MTQEIQPTGYKRRNTIIAAGSGAGLVLAGLLVGGTLSGAFRGENTGSTSNPTQRPSATELATPRPSEAAGTPEPSKLPEAKIENFTVEKLGTFEVLPGDMISGDVAMSNTTDSAIFPLFDQDTLKASDVTDNTKTALYVDVQAPGVVHAEWGATVTRGLTAEKKAEMLKLQAISKERAGFDKVDVVLWTGYDTTVDQAGSKANGGEGQEVLPLNSDVNINDVAEGGIENLDNQSKIKVVLSMLKLEGITPEQEKVLMNILVNCLCNCETPTETPKPSETPKPTAKPSKSPEACVPTMNDHVMKSGETYKVPAGIDFIAQGDVTIDGKKTYDSLDKTGAISVITDQKANTIKAPWGADIQVFECATDAFVDETYKHDLEQLRATNRSLDKNSINQLK